MKIRENPTYILVFTLVLSTILSGCSLPGKRGDVPKIEMVVNNTLNVKRVDEFVVLKVSELKGMAPDFNTDAFIVIQPESNQEIPNQLDDINNDGEGDEIAMIMDMEPGEKKNIEIRYAPEGRPVALGYKKRTRAAIHPEYEGIVWESELIAYRIYLDQRNSVSVFGKQEMGLSLDKFASSGDYNKVEPWGVSVLDGGNSLGCGGFGVWQNGLIKPHEGTNVYPRIAADGPIRSVVQVFYKNWRVGDQSLNVSATYSIYAGQVWTRTQIKISTNMPAKIAAGLAKSATANFTKDETAGYFHTWGNQSRLNPPDALGMAMIYPKENFDSFSDDGKSGSYLLALNSDSNGETVYWSLASWNRGEIGTKDEKQFTELVSSIAQRLKNPLTVTIMPVKPRQEKEKK